jgi:4'-phosphopantetheinyl transferase EntD
MLRARCMSTERGRALVEAARLAILRLLPDGVAVEVGAPDEAAGPLHAEEAAFISKAAPLRRAEFATGRQLARNALARLGVRDVPLLPDADRAPRWPAGTVGSLSHTRALCAVAVQRTCSLRSIGLDLEPTEGLGEDLRRHVLTPREHELLRARTRDGTELALMGRLVFSAKECFYKCQYPLTRRFLEFHDVELDLDPKERRFVARPRRALGLSGEPRFEGRWEQAAEHWITAMALPVAENSIDE